MANKINYHKAAIREGRKAVVDAAGVAFPKLGTAIGITGTITHSVNAIKYGRKAAEISARRRVIRVRKTVNRKISPIRRALRRLK